MKSNLRLTTYDLRLKLSLIVISICAPLLALYGCQSKKLYKNKCLAMGTFLEVISCDQRAFELVAGETRRLENLLSRYKTDSEISKLNRTGKLKVSPDTFFVIKKSKEFSKATDGAFDITVGALLDLWGFSDKQFRIPDDSEIRALMPLIGSDKIVLQEAENVVEFRVPGMKIDLGGIAKGYALDCAAAKLKEKSIKGCLINLGGQILCLGDNAGRPWKVALRSARSKTPVSVLEVKDESVATSADYEQFFIKNNRRFAHIIDPKTGRPAQSLIASVSVVAPSGIAADALSTAVFIMGNEETENLRALFPKVKIIITPDTEHTQGI